MDVGLPHSAVAPGPEGEVLVVLARTSAGLTGRQVASRVKRSSQPSVNRALQRLVASGLVNGQPVGRAMLYTLNRDHLAAPAVELISSLRAELIRRLTKRLAGAPQPVHASLFGSAARGDGDLSSDIDLFVVRPAAVKADDAKWRARLDRLADDVRSWTGNALSVAEVSSADIARLRNARPAIVKALETEAVDLAGVPARYLLRRHR